MHRSSAGAIAAGSGFRGVSKIRNRWQAYISPIGKTKVSLGCFDTPKDAAIVYDAEVLKLNLEEKRTLNFRWSSATAAGARADEVRKREASRAAEAQQNLLQRTNDWDTISCILWSSLLHKSGMRSCTNRLFMQRDCALHVEGFPYTFL